MLHLFEWLYKNLSKDMQLKELVIQNFRNFKDLSIDLNNKNILFGMNDVGKSNFIHSLRMLFDYRIRGQEVSDTDFYMRNITESIFIRCKLDLSDKESSDVQKLLTAAKNSKFNDASNDFFIQLEVAVDQEKRFMTLMSWGDDPLQLDEIPSLGVNRLILDTVFSVIYIPSHIEIDRYFVEFKRKVLTNAIRVDSDTVIEEQIKEAYRASNRLIENLSTIKEIRETLNVSLKQFDETYSVQITSNSSVDDVYKQLRIFTQDHESIDNQLYPASGDGRQKKIMYAMIHYLLEQERTNYKVPILLMEEPENHLFLSAQVDISDTMFDQENAPYLFLTTHSPQLFYRISDNANLIRLFKENQQTKSNSAAVCVPEEYAQIRQIYLENLAHCFFVERVLLVEGPSEKLLFDFILDNNVDRNIRQKIYVLPVMGVDFKPYWNILRGLGIKVVVRTDNDVYGGKLVGLNRCLKLLGREDVLAPLWIEGDSFYVKNKVHEEYDFDIDLCACSNIYLAKIDLENDLSVALSGEFQSQEKLVEWLQKKKWQHMFEFISKNLTSEQSKKLYNHELFKCLKVAAE